jgi:hypothetical protein
MLHSSDERQQEPETNKRKSTALSARRVVVLGNISIRRIIFRKFFHTMVVLMFIPATILRPKFLALAYLVALIGFILVEATRLILVRNNV